MASLASQKPSDTFDSLLHVEDDTAGLVATSTDSRVIQDGVGQSSALALSTDSIRVVGTSKLYINDVGGEYISGDGSDLTLTAGTDILLTAGANIGIGTTSPNYKVEIEGSRVTGNATRILSIKDPGTSDADGGGFLQFSSDDGAAMVSGHHLGRINFAGAEDGNNNLEIGASIFVLANGTWAGDNHPTSIHFATCKDGTDEIPQKRMTIIDTGHVGIGTATPAATLDVRGTAQVYNTTNGADAVFYLNATNDSAASKYFALVQDPDDATNGQLNIIPNSLSSGNAVVSIESGGNVGIGTNAPESLCHIKKYC